MIRVKIWCSVEGYKKVKTDLEITQLSKVPFDNAADSMTVKVRLHVCKSVYIIVIQNPIAYKILFVLGIGMYNIRPDVRSDYKLSIQNCRISRSDILWPGIKASYPITRYQGNLSHGPISRPDIH